MLHSLRSRPSRPTSRLMSTSTSTAIPIPPTDKYLFDLRGYLVLRSVLSPLEVLAANSAIDSRSHLAAGRGAPGVRNAREGTGLGGEGERRDLGGMLEWEGDDSAVFRSVLAHPRLAPYFNAFLGPGYRLDHLPFLILQHPGSEGFSLHGGVTDVRTGRYNHHLGHEFRNGDVRCNLLACEVVLSDHPEGMGGWCVVPGSHKSNLPAPAELIENGSEIGEGGSLSGLRDACVQPAVKAGDVILFSEGTVHGAAPWRNEHERRVALYRFSPGFMGYGRGYSCGLEGGFYPKRMTEGMTEAEKAVCLPPFATHLDREVVGDDGRVVDGAGKRTEEKKTFDRRVFGVDYY